MSNGAAVAYLYDGSFEGLLCVVFESFHRRERPLLIFSQQEPQETLYPVWEVETDMEAARKVEASIVSKISKYALRLVRLCYLASEAGRECWILDFLRLGYRMGSSVTNLLSHDLVMPIIKTARQVEREAMMYRNFARFSEYDGSLVARISPVHFVLPLIAPHFCDRFPSESFLIYDDIHQAALVYYKGKRDIVRMEQLTLPELSAEEALYRELWKRFYHSISIKERENPKLRMQHMPKRYWSHMTEFL